MIDVIYLLNERFERITPIRDFVSFIWTSKARSPGNVNMVLTKKYYEDLMNAKYVENPNDKYHLALIQHIKIDDDFNGSLIEVGGNHLEHQLSLRVLEYEYNTDRASPEYVIKKILNDNVINPMDQSRKVPNFVLGDFIDTNIKISYKGEKDTVLKEIEKICDVTKLCFRLRVENSIMYFDLYKGEDRTSKQDKNLKIVFDKSIGTALKTTYTKDNSTEANFAYIKGAEDINETVDESKGAIGFERKEIIINSTNVQRQIQTSSGTVVIAEKYYRNMLKDDGKEKLAKLKENEFVEGEISEFFKINEDFFLGDLVTTLDSTTGKTTDNEVSEVLESQGSDGYKLNPTIGKNTIVTQDKVKIITKGESK